jgi:hypothetical protein
MAPPLEILRRMSYAFLQLLAKIRPLFPYQAAENRSNHLHSQTAISDPPQSANPGSSEATMAA